MFLKRQIPFNNLGPETTPTVKDLFDRYKPGTYRKLTESLRAVFLLFALHYLDFQTRWYQAIIIWRGSRVAVVLRALPSDQCVPGSIPARCRDLSLLLVFAVIWVFFLRVLQKKVNEVASSLNIVIYLISSISTCFCFIFYSYRLQETVGEEGHN